MSINPNKEAELLITALKQEDTRIGVRLNDGAFVYRTKGHLDMRGIVYEPSVVTGKISTFIKENRDKISPENLKALQKEAYNRESTLANRVKELKGKKREEARNAYEIFKVFSNRIDLVVGRQKALGMQRERLVDEVLSHWKRENEGKWGITASSYDIALLGADRLAASTLHGLLQAAAAVYPEEESLEASLQKAIQDLPAFVAKCEDQGVPVPDYIRLKSHLLEEWQGAIEKTRASLPKSVLTFLKTLAPNPNQDPNAFLAIAAQHGFRGTNIESAKQHLGLLAAAVQKLDGQLTEENMKKAVAKGVSFVRECIDKHIPLAPDYVAYSLIQEKNYQTLLNRMAGEGGGRY